MINILMMWFEKNVLTCRSCIWDAVKYVLCKFTYLGKLEMCQDTVEPVSKCDVML